MLFRLPQKGDFIRPLKSGTIIEVTTNWPEMDRVTASDYEFVTVTPVAPPASRYFNIMICEKGVLHISGVGWDSRQEADKFAPSDRVACVNLVTLVGQYDD